MKNRTCYYARVSSKEQNLDRQLEAFKKLGADDRDIITDKESGKSLDRPGYQALKTTILREGDTLIVKSLDRLSRNKIDIRNDIEFPENWDDVYSEWQSGNISAVEAMKMLGMKKSSFYKLVKKSQ